MIFHVNNHVTKITLKGRFLVKLTNISGSAIAAILSTTILAGGYGTMAYAQDDTSRLGGFEDEVIVTARKRQETVQDIPVAITAFTGEGLEARGITSIAEVGNLAPNVTYQNNPNVSGASSVASVYIRGIGQRDFLGTIDNGSGFYIDDVLVARTVGAVVDLFDVERVEVLRGPQGTLNGRNNVGGAVKIHTKRPTLASESYEGYNGYVEGTYGTDDLFSLKGTVDFAVGENAAIKFSGLHTEQDGYVDRPASGTKLGGKNVDAVRAAFLWEPTDNLEVYATATYTDEDDDGPAFVLVETGSDFDGGFGFFHNNFNSGSADCLGPFGPGGPDGGITSTNPLCYNNLNFVDEDRDVNLGTADTFSRIETLGINADIKYTINENLSIRSITGYREIDSDFQRDSDASPFTIQHLNDTFVSEQFSQELTLNANLFDGALDFVTGVYYFDENGENVNNLEFAIANFVSGSEFGTESKAVYAQGTWHATDRLDITLGGRYTEEDKEFFPDQFVESNVIGIPFLDETGTCVTLDRTVMGPSPDAVNIQPVALPPFAQGACPVRLLPFEQNERSTNEFTPTVNLAYDVTDELLGYATFSQGFRSGGFAQRVFPPLPVALDFDPEFVDSYELGFKYKNDFLTFNAAGFFTDYTDIQGVTEVDGFVGVFEDNVGDAEIKGIELESLINPADGLYIELSYGYTDAEYTEITVTPGLVTDISLDSEFDRVPEHSFSGSITKEFNLSGGDIITRLDTTYWSEYFNDPDNSPEILTPDTFLANASIRWIPADDKYNLTVGVKNLTDEEYLQSGYLADSIGNGEAIFDRGRQWYVTARANF